MENKKSYYAIIPANVRYDEELSPNAKLLYGEITALCNDKGYCWASNEYFSQLYGKSTRTIRRWITELIQKKYVVSEINKDDGNLRLISIADPLRTKMSIPMDKNVLTPMDKNVTHNNTYMNNTLNNNSHIYCSNSRDKNKKKFNSPTIEEVEEYAKSRNSNVDVQKFFDYYSVAKWHDRDGKPIKNWKQKLITWEGRSTSKETKGYCEY